MHVAATTTRPARPRRADALVAAGVAAVAQAETWLAGPGPRAAYAAAALALAVPLAWRRVAPLAVLATVFVPLFAMRLLGHPLDAAYVMLVLLLAFSAVGAYAPRPRAVAGLGLGLGLVVALVALERAVGGESAPGAGDAVFIGGIAVVVWALGVGLHERGQRAGELAEHADRLERDRELRARAAVADERARIARELHDVVAHSVSVIAVQTGSVRRRLRHERPAEAAELLRVEETAREALAEMRRMLGLLRTDGDEPGLAPQPGIGELERLVEQMRAAGVPVDLQVDGERHPVAPGVELAAYRVVQEALTNVLKHAGQARARVRVRYGRTEVELDVSDDGDGAARAGAPADGDGGHGLVGMRERIALYGGSLEVGPRPGGGFGVHARLPVTAP